jgi:hypothetical protein
VIGLDELILASEASNKLIRFNAFCFCEALASMTKALRTAAELTALINAGLSKHAVCNNTSVEGISPVADDRINHNWTCKFLRRSGELASPDCQQILATVVHQLQQKYDLAPEE